MTPLGKVLLALIGLGVVGLTVTITKAELITGIVLSAVAALYCTYMFWKD